MIDIESRDGVSTLKVQGELSVRSAVEIHEELQNALKAGEGEVVLDLSEVEEMDTAGAQVLVVMRREARLMNKHFSIIAHSPASHNVLETFGLYDYFEK